MSRTSNNGPAYRPAGHRISTGVADMPFDQCRATHQPAGAAAPGGGDNTRSGTRQVIDTQCTPITRFHDTNMRLVGSPVWLPVTQELQAVGTDIVVHRRITSTDRSTMVASPAKHQPGTADHTVRANVVPGQLGARAGGRNRRETAGT